VNPRLALESIEQNNGNFRSAAYITLSIATISGILVFIFNIWYTTAALTEGVFLIRDITMYLARIQALRHGLWPPPDLLNGYAVFENPYTTTLSFLFSALLFESTQLYSDAILGLAALNTITMIFFIFSAFVLFISTNRKANPVVFLVVIIILAFGSDLAGLQYLLGLYNQVVYRGIWFPVEFRTPLSIAGYYIPGFPEDIYFKGFHHAIGVIIFLFAFSLIFRLKIENYKKRTFFVIIALLAVSIFCHIGVTFILSGVTILALAIYLILTSVYDTTWTSILKNSKPIHLTRVILVSSVFLLIPLSPILAQVGVILRFRFPLLINDLPSDLYYRVYLGEMVLASVLYFSVTLVFSVIGYLFLNRQRSRIGDFILLSLAEVLFLFNVLFIPYRPTTGGAHQHIGMFSVMPLQVILILLTFFGLFFIQRNFIQQKLSFGFKEILGRDYESQNGNQTINKFSAPKLYYVLFFLILILLSTPSYANTFHMYSSNYGEFHRDFYVTVPTIPEDEWPAYAWIRENTAQNAIILADPDNWEITAICGRAVIYSAYRFSENDSRYIDIGTIYNTTDMALANSILSGYNVSFIFLSPIEYQKYNGTTKFQTNPSYYELVYNHQNIAIFRYLLN
jgi:hypothetical protein